MMNNEEKDCTDSGIGSLNGDNLNADAENSMNNSLTRPSDTDSRTDGPGDGHSNLMINKNFRTQTSTPKSRIVAEIDPVEFGNATFLSNTSKCNEPHRYVLRSTTKDQSTDLKDSVFDNTVADDDNDLSYVAGSNFIFNKSESNVFLDLNHFVIVEDESDKDLEEISDKFLKSLKTTSGRKANRNQPKTKRMLWSPNRYHDFEDQPPFEEEIELDGQTSRATQFNASSKEIKLKIPIPTFLVPVQFSKRKPNGDYSPVTKNVLNTPKSIHRKVQLNRTTTFPNQICGFLESLDADIIPTKFSDPNALYYRDNYLRKRNELLNRLVLLYDQKVFDGKLSNDSVLISWAKVTVSTNSNCEFRKNGDDRTATIKLSDNIPTASTLRDTVIAELCRAAAWVLNPDEELESGWKTWAERANERIPELPLIQINGHYEFVYECIICNLRSFAHSQPKNIEKTFCAHCHGPIKVYRN